MILTYFGIVAAIFFGDNFLKNRIEEMTEEELEAQQKKRSNRIIIRKYHNPGAMLNMGEKNPKTMAVLATILTGMSGVVFLLSLWKWSLPRNKKNGLVRFGMSLLLGGALSNTYDRWKRGYVVDYVSFPVKGLKRIVFNISDFCIMAGAAFASIGSSKK